MKAKFSLLLLSLAVSASAQTLSSNVVSSYAVAERGPHQRIWQQVVSQTNLAGQTISKTNSYTELATGLCYWNGSQWADASDQIQITTNGAAATNTQHQVAFSANINTTNAITLTTPDSQQMTSQILGLAYFDADADTNVLFAEIQDSIGQLLPSGNQVIYTNAFTNANCDVLFTHRLSGIEQDIIIRQQLPSPSSVGLSGSNIWLQVWTEFPTAPTPTVTENTNDGDSFLDFGAMKMGRGKAFMLGGPSNAVPVIKEWLNSGGRTFLIESVPLNSIAAQIATLPSTAALRGTRPPSGAVRRALASNPPHPGLNHLRLPAPKLAKTSQGPIRLTVANPAAKGFVLDYNLTGSQTNFTFQSDNTYYVTNEVDLYGANVIEGGTVLKFSTNSAASIILGHATNVVFQTGPYRPVIFTAQDDDSVGAQISGSTGIPTNYYGGTGLKSPYSSLGSPAPWKNLRFSYLRQGMDLEDNNFYLYDIQFVCCQQGVYLDTAWFYLRNALFSNVPTNFYCQPDLEVFDLENVTVHNSSVFCDIAGYEDFTYTGDPGDWPNFYMAITNCLLVNVTNIGPPLGLYGYTDTNTTVILTNDTGVFQTVGAGNHYLATNIYRGCGTTNIASTLLADLAQKTTWPPIVFADTTISNDTIFSPQIPRDTNAALDLGYHYDAIDYALGGVLLTGSNVGVYPGTVIATFGTSNTGYGINVGSNVDFLCQGLATTWNRIIEYNTVQEEYGNAWLTPTNGMITDLLNYYEYSTEPAVEVNCRFTDWSVMAADAPHISITNESPVYLRDCQFYGGDLLLNYVSPPPGPDPSINNCLLERVNTILYVSDGSTTLVEDSLFFGGTFNFTPSNATATVQNNLFDGTSIPDNSSNSVSYTGGYNAYITNSTNFQLQPVSTNDLILSAEPVYRTGPLGKYYLDSIADSSLIGAGSTNANVLGLYDYTVLTNMIDGQEIKETNGLVSISYHYVAVDSSGNPISTYTNGLPDYLVTSSTSAIPDWWEYIYFGNLDQGTNASYNGDGTNNLQKYLNGTDPNIIQFAVSVSNQYVSSSPVAAVINVLGGVPSSIAVLVDSTNFSSATWSAYTSSNISISIGSTDGPHDIWVGLRGLPTNAFQTWDETTVILDSVSPAITITNPANNVSLNSSRINICGNFSCESLQQITVNGVLAFINGTNFEALNVPLSANTNTITAVVQDFDGDTNVTSINVVGLTNSDGSMNDPIELSASPVGGFYPLPVTFQVQTNYPGTLSNVFYDFNGDDIADFTTNNTASLTYTYSTNGEFFPVVTVQTSLGRFSSIGGWNSGTLFPIEQILTINVQTPVVQISTISITNPVDIKWTATSNLYVLSGSTATITEYDTNGNVIASLSGIGSNPSGLDVDSAGNVYVAMTGSNQVWRFYPTNSTFAVDSTFGTNGYGFIGLTNGATGTNNGEFNAPYDVAVSPDGSTVSVSDSGNNQIQQFDTNGNFIGVFGGLGTNIGQLNSPAGLTYDDAGYLYIVDSGNNRIALSLSTAIIGVSGTNGSALSQFSDPLNVSVGMRGIYVSDTGNNRIEVFDPTGFGVPPTPLNLRFSLSSVLGLNNPQSVTVVADFLHENIYIADTGNNRVLLVNLPLDDPSVAWTNMTNSIITGDISGATQYFSSLSADNYRQAFLALGSSNLISAITTISAISPSVIENQKAEYYFTNVIEGQTITFPIQFTKENGLWKILEY